MKFSQLSLLGFVAIVGPTTNVAADSCFELKTEYGGKNSFELNAKDSYECQAICQTKTEQECSWFTFSRGRCYLKPRKEKISPEVKFGDSGPRFCEPKMLIPATSLPFGDISRKNTKLGGNCIVYGLHYDGPTIHLQTTENERICQNVCEHHAECHFWTFDEGKCVLKKEKGNEVIKEHGASGKKRCPRFHTCFHTGLEVEPNKQFEIQYKSADNPRKCRHSCIKNSECEYFTFYNDSKLCRLHRRGALITMKSNPNAVLGARDCFPEWCISIGLKLPVQQGWSKYFYTAADCQEKCASMKDCNIFRHDSITSTCWVHEKTTIEPADRTYDDAFSGGPKHCGTQDCFDKGYDYFGEDLDITGKAESPEECQRKCYANPDCFFFTYHAPDKGCYLKKKTSIKNRRVKDVSVSGPYKCM